MADGPGLGFGAARLLAGLGLFLSAAASALDLPLPPDPGLETSVRAADVIAEVEVLSGGPFHALACVRTIYKGEVQFPGGMPPLGPPRPGGAAPSFLAVPSPLRCVIELEGFNSTAGDTIHRSFVAGRREVLFLSRTGRKGAYAPLTPAAPRLPCGEDSVLISLGDPPFNIPIRPADFRVALNLLLNAEEQAAPRAGAAETIRALWGRNEVEARYLAVMLAGAMREERALDMLAEAAGDKLLRLRLTAVEALKRLASSAARRQLRGLLADGKSTVAREAAAALIALRDREGSAPMLAWAMREAEQMNRLPPADPRRETSQNALTAFLVFLDEEGALLPQEQLGPALLQLSQDRNSILAGQALFVLGGFGGPAQAAALCEMANDPLHPRQREASLSLLRIFLTPGTKLEELRTWRRIQQELHGDEYPARRARQAVLELLFAEPEEERHELTAVLRAAPGEDALAAVASMLVRLPPGEVFDSSDLTFWRTPLALPFLLSWLGAGEMERRRALEGLANLARRHPRLRACTRPYFRALLSDPSSGMRRAGALAAAMLRDEAALPAILHNLRTGGYEAQTMSRAVFELSARTLGYGYYEPTTDRRAALDRLDGWWQARRGARWTVPSAAQPEPLAPEAAQAEELERLALAPLSRPAGAAFAVLFAARGPEHPFWRRLLASKRERDRAHGLLGLLGASPDLELANAGGRKLHDFLAALVSGEESDSDLVRAQAFVVLAGLQGGRGGACLADWLAGKGAEERPFWRSLAIALLGLADGEARSAETLAKQIARATEAKREGNELVPDPPERRCALTALLARSDASPALEAALASRDEEVRETAFRALCMRRHRPSLSKLFDAAGLAGTFSAQELAHHLAAWLEPQDLPVLREKLIGEQSTTRLVAAAVLAARPELAGEEATQDALAAACRDELSYVRENAAEALGRARAAGAAGLLRKLLDDPDEDVSAAAAAALGEVGDQDACREAARSGALLLRLDKRYLPAMARGAMEDDVALLVKLAGSEAHSDRRAGVEALGYSPREEALVALRELFRDDGAPLQTLAGEALLRRSSQLPRILASDLAHTKPRERARALQWLARLPREALPYAAEALLTALDDPEPTVRALSDFALRSLSGRNADFDPQAAPAARQEAIRRWKELLEKPMR